MSERKQMYEAADEIATPDGPRLTDLAHHGSEADPVEGTEMAGRRRSTPTLERVRTSADYSDNELRELAKAGYDPFASWRFDRLTDSEKRRMARA